MRYQPKKEAYHYIRIMLENRETYNAADAGGAAALPIEEALLLARR
jgi:hypothetical protein